MERRKFIKNAVFLGGASALQPGSAVLNIIAAPGQTKVYPKAHDRALINPMMGWVLHFYDNNLFNYGSRLAPSDTVDDYPGLSTVYLRIAWAYIEPERGKFNWQMLDAPAQRWIDKGKKVAFRITATEGNIRYATPGWVHRAGAGGTVFREDRWEPDYDDPVFLDAVDGFLSAMAARYDGNPNVAFIDLGHFGIWGEGHTYWSSKKNYGLDAKKTHVDLYTKHFKKTLLAVSDDYAGANDRAAHLPLTDYAFSKGVTLRDDSILVGKGEDAWFHDELAQQFWPTLPVILEPEHYGSTQRKETWDKELFYRSVEAYHASYMSVHWWPREFLAENADVVDRINLRLGYRLQVKSAGWPEEVRVGDVFKIEHSWSNAGVAPCYPGGHPCFTIMDRNGGIVWLYVDENINAMNFEVSEKDRPVISAFLSEFTISPRLSDPVSTLHIDIPPGEYDIYVSVGDKDGTPRIALPYDDADKSGKRYKLGRVRLLERGG